MADLSHLREALGPLTDGPPGRLLVVHPDDAARFGLVEGDRYGDSEVRIELHVLPGKLFVIRNDLAFEVRRA